MYDCIYTSTEDGIYVYGQQSHSCCARLFVYLQLVRIVATAESTFSCLLDVHVGRFRAHVTGKKGFGPRLMKRLLSTCWNMRAIAGLRRPAVLSATGHSMTGITHNETHISAFPPRCKQQHVFSTVIIELCNTLYLCSSKLTAGQFLPGTRLQYREGIMQTIHACVALLKSEKSACKSVSNTSNEINDSTKAGHIVVPIRRRYFVYKQTQYY